GEQPKVNTSFVVSFILCENNNKIGYRFTAAVISANLRIFGTIMAYKFIDNYRERGARKQLVELLKRRGIEDKRVLAAIGKVPRHYFFDETFWNQAYRDIAFPIGDGQTISQPYTVAYQTELLHIERGDRVLEIGTGSGYQTCI